jgi:small subunit ribosomal protein S17
MSKTASVLVERRDPHPIYKKLVLKSTKYAVHDPEEKCVAGDKILFEKSRPFSKQKHWIYRATLARNPANEYLTNNPEVAQMLEKSERRARSQESATSGRV